MIGTCYLDKQLLGDISDTFRDYLREIQVESQAVYVQRLLEEESSGKSSCLGNSKMFMEHSSPKQ
ncbi:hypothetical protein HID58_073705 [Brassica napus]|uniref:Uncharacterized protein n=1 Tax=Brassica napus TaxID=3708 RepID=A0ABQ7X8P1_BRANA|nr:hypothetical protein HID58_094077 [Brassica napus]KAH0852605.1 hypothetical protein HID58_093870 [Brassica napus]KAH0852606.1 hypothetical protein HID58_093871 [Brassica napus]KAH0854415.1 hypothetical protein HID58_073705 [Brassica napus]